MVVSAAIAAQMLAGAALWVGGGAAATDGPGAGTPLFGPTGLAADRRGNVYIAEAGNNAIRMLTPAGRIVTVAGDGSPGYVDGVGGHAEFCRLGGLALGPDGALYAVAGLDEVRRIDVRDPARAVVTTLVRPGGYLHDAPGSVAVDVHGRVWVGSEHEHGYIGTNGYMHTVLGTHQPGQLATMGGYRSRGFVLDRHGWLVLKHNDQLVRVSATGKVLPFASLPPGEAAPGADAMAWGPDGALVVALGGKVFRVAPGGRQATWLADDGAAREPHALPPHVVGLAVGPGGEIYVSEACDDSLRKLVVDPVGQVTVTVVAGGRGPTAPTVDGTARQAVFQQPGALVADMESRLYLADAGHDAIRAIEPDGRVLTVCGPFGFPGFQLHPTDPRRRPSDPRYLALDHHGDLLVAGSHGARIVRVDLHHAGHPVSTWFESPADLTADQPWLATPPRAMTAAGDVPAVPAGLVAEPGGTVLVGWGPALVRLGPGNQASRVALLGGPARPLARDSDGTLFAFVERDGRGPGQIVAIDGAGRQTVLALAGDDGGADAPSWPEPPGRPLWVGPARRGDHLPVDGPAGIGRLLGTPRAAALAPDRALWLADGTTNGLRRIGRDRVVSTFRTRKDVAPGWQANATADNDFPAGLAFGPTGQIYIADGLNRRVREVGRAAVGP